MNTTKYDLIHFRTIYDNEEEITERIKTKIFKKLIAMIMKIQMDQFMLPQDQIGKKSGIPTTNTTKKKKDEKPEYTKEE